MFLRAGFNPRHFDTGVRAWSRGVVVRLIRFVPSGDLAWNGRGFLTWGSTCAFRDLIEGPVRFSDCYGPQSRLPA